MRISDWSSDVCSSDLDRRGAAAGPDRTLRLRRSRQLHLRPACPERPGDGASQVSQDGELHPPEHRRSAEPVQQGLRPGSRPAGLSGFRDRQELPALHVRSEEHTSELQSLMRISYAVFCLKKKIDKQNSNYIKNRPRNNI